MTAPNRRRAVVGLLALSLSIPMLAVPVLTGAALAAADPAAPASGSDRAWSWIVGQLGSGTTVTSASTIAADQPYGSDWTGPVRGTFALDGVSAPVIPSAVAVDQPAAVPGDYAGAISGHVTLAPQQWRWIIQAYRDTPAGRVQAPAQALVAPDGTFTLDLSALDSQPSGAWAFGVLDAFAGYAPTGDAWPSPGRYDGLSVRALVTTDATYDIGSAPANADGSFAFPDSRPGTKWFQLIDAAGDVLAEQAPDFGVVRSFGPTQSAGAVDGADQRAYVYDQAMAVLAGVTRGAAELGRLTDGLLAFQATGGAQAGGFADVASARNPAAAAPVYRTGSSAIATYALLRRIETMSPADPTLPALLDRAESAVSWLRAQQTASGLVRGGAGAPTPGGVDPAPIGWQSTEHALDSWHALDLASRVLSGSAASGAGAAADSLRSAIVSLLWTGAGFRQGIDPTGAPDDTDTLDAQSWGAIFLHDIGRDDLAAIALDRAQLFAAQDGPASGYRAYYPQPAFPAAPELVWFEGTAGVAAAQQLLGRDAAASETIAELAAAQRPDGALPYATADDGPTSMTSAPSIASTAWFALVAG